MWNMSARLNMAKGVSPLEHDFAVCAFADTRPNGGSSGMRYMRINSHTGGRPKPQATVWRGVFGCARLRTDPRSKPARSLVA
jgi:hypothetical protein